MWQSASSSRSPDKQHPAERSTRFGPRSSSSPNGFGSRGCVNGKHGTKRRCRSPIFFRSLAQRSSEFETSAHNSTIDSLELQVLSCVRLCSPKRSRLQQLLQLWFSADGWFLRRVSTGLWRSSLLWVWQHDRGTKNIFEKQTPSEDIHGPLRRVKEGMPLSQTPSSPVPCRMLEPHSGFLRVQSAQCVLLRCCRVSCIRSMTETPMNSLSPRSGP